MYKLRSR